MAATFRRTLLAGLFVLAAGTGRIAAAATPESAADSPPPPRQAAYKETPAACLPPDCPDGLASDVTAVPEPAALFLLGTGVVLLTAHRRRRLRPRG